jgi:hypothetical protein
MDESTQIESLEARLMALEVFVQEFMAAVIAASPEREQLAARLRALSDHETSESADPDLHWRATMAEYVLRRLPSD